MTHLDQKEVLLIEDLVDLLKADSAPWTIERTTGASRKTAVTVMDPTNPFVLGRAERTCVFLDRSIMINDALKALYAHPTFAVISGELDRRLIGTVKNAVRHGVTPLIEGKPPLGNIPQLMLAGARQWCESTRGALHPKNLRSRPTTAA